MKLKMFFAYFLLVPAVLFLAQGCNDCDVAGAQLTFSADNQYLQITYLVDSNGANYCTDVYNPNNVQVLFNDNGGFGQFVPLSEDLSDGVIGPFNYTVEPNNVRKGEFNHYVYVIQKDTFGIDTVDIKFYPRVDECQEYWGLVEFFLNGVLLPPGPVLEICDVTVEE